jgi:ring-1,2-phenylacetyl-CoA epoxidase subunit PaaA/ring-1,2-phenylacetyl-CoA epoxidase subunit PaaC
MPTDTMACLLGRLAQAKHGLGHRLAFAGPAAPALEAAVATVAMAQEELGHARLLYASEAQERGGSATPEGGFGAGIQTTPPDPDLVPPFTDWAEAIAAMATFDSGLRLWLEALTADGETWLRQRAARMLAEERFHAEYVRHWVQLLRAGAAAGPRLSAALAAAGARARRWTGELEALASGLRGAGRLARVPSRRDFDHAVAAILGEPLPG